jgi:hypothetical protein
VRVLINAENELGQRAMVFIDETFEGLLFDGPSRPVFRLSAH